MYCNRTLIAGSGVLCYGVLLWFGGLDELIDRIDPIII